MHPTDDMTRPVRLGALSMAKVMRALMDGPCSIQELKIISGLSINTLHEYMRALRKEGVAHIGAWEKDATGRDSLRVYKLGSGRDAPRTKKSKAEVARDCRKRKQDAQLSQSFAIINPAPAHHSKPMRQVSARNVLEPALP